MNENIVLYFNSFDNFDEAKSSFLDGINAIINGELFSENEFLMSLNEDYQNTELSLTDLELIRDYVQNLQPD
ncbi:MULTISPECIES: hypothetical protein [unclassified Pseudoalteromonas]|uniref:hypothetical protein n=1 Tax=unclassified Pseudoalteromonas TaxID=194690 RepID=UPI000BAE246B|nr:MULTISPECIES: hypothetical protein [unclassified Pseudoalteromonas]MBR8841686.1 hypothetical protein [Pseudoalteromonas sp. JC3]PAX99575.1 hypothetical protein CKO50_20400 [Pseudoalteromonas sp. HM-SA03]WJE07710.1 hypothetical protein QSH61_12495 [Pseudoalteromonas sp. JC3]